MGNRRTSQKGNIGRTGEQAKRYQVPSLVKLNAKLRAQHEHHFLALYLVKFAGGGLAATQTIKKLHHFTDRQVY